jgi:glycosyltransferase involved in cell wall biosynthesis
VSSSSVAVIVITRDRRDELLETLSRLEALTHSGEASEVVVVDNDSSDGTAAAVREAHPKVRVLRQRRNLGAPGRTVGVRSVDSELVAFADDDSWWDPGSLVRAARCFADVPGLGLLHSRLVVHPDGSTDGACLQMARGPRDPALPGPSIVGHLACGVVVRRSAYLQTGGYSRLLGFGGEERLLALDLARLGWAQCYVKDVVAHHRPSPRREPWPQRWARYRRNDTLTAVLRLPAGQAVGELRSFVADARREPAVRREVLPLAVRLPAALVGRRGLPADVLALLGDVAATERAVA